MQCLHYSQRLLHTTEAVCVQCWTQYLTNEDIQRGCGVYIIASDYATIVAVCVQCWTQYNVEGSISPTSESRRDAVFTWHSATEYQRCCGPVLVTSLHNYERCCRLHYLRQWLPNMFQTSLPQSMTTKGVADFTTSINDYQKCCRQHYLSQWLPKVLLTPLPQSMTTNHVADFTTSINDYQMWCRLYYLSQ